MLTGSSNISDVNLFPKFPPELRMSDFQTPIWCCRLMRSLIPPGCRTVLEPTPGEGNLVSVLGGLEVTAPVDFWGLPDGHWDCTVMNPPFSPMEQGYRILYRCMGMSSNLVALMPWLTMINSGKRTVDIKRFGLVSVTHLPRSTFKGARVQCCLLQMAKGYTGATEMKFIDGTGNPV